MGQLEECARCLLLGLGVLACGPQPQVASSTKPVSTRPAVPGVALDAADRIRGDWSLGGLAKLHVADDFTTLAWGAPDDSHRRKFVVVSAQGDVVEFEATDPTHPPDGDELDMSFARRARFVVVSESVGCFMDSIFEHGVVAYREGAVPAAALGRYLIGESSVEYSAVELRANVVRLERRNGESQTLDVVGVGETAGDAVALMVRGDDLAGVLRLLKTPRGVVFELEDRQGIVVPTTLVKREKARAVPASNADAGQQSRPAPQGKYTLLGFMAPSLDGDVDVAGTRWRLPWQHDELSGESHVAQGVVVGGIGAQLIHVHAPVPGSANAIVHLDLRALEGDADSFLVASSDADPQVFSVRGYGWLTRQPKPAAAWAPSRGLEDDLQRLCRELGALPAPATPKAIELALQRVGEQASSVSMRSFCADALTSRSSVGVTYNLQWELQRVLWPLPTCPGIARLAELKITFESEQPGLSASAEPEVGEESELAQGADDAVVLGRVLQIAERGPFTLNSESALLRLAHDDSRPAGIRAQAVVAYAKVAAAIGHAPKAVADVKGLRAVAGLQYWDALAALGASAVPVLVPALGKCSRSQGRMGAVLDPNATIDLSDDVLAATTIGLILERNADGAEAVAAAPELIKGLGCGDARVRTSSAHALAMLGGLSDPLLSKLRQLSQHDERSQTRALACAVLGSLASPAEPSLEALDHALSDRDELVRAAAGNALLGLGPAVVGAQRAARARAALQTLVQSQDREIAASAQGALDQHPSP
jgi:hypothetical protein